MDEWFAQNPLMGALGGVIALGILIYMLVIMTRNVGEDLPREPLEREVDLLRRMPPPY
jgi:hypothetical protein